MKSIHALMALFVAVAVSACETPLPAPNEVQAPAPILNNTGQYMSPFTQDAVLAPWVDKAINVKLGSEVGGTVGSLAAQQAMGQVPFVGGILGDMAGKEMGRQIALKAIGGEDYIKKSSDMSFNTVDDLAVYIYAKNSAHPHYQDALDATEQVYPDLKDHYEDAIRNAPLRSSGDQSNAGDQGGVSMGDAKKY